MAKQQTLVSAPGKVLITGGYLVLDQRFKGIVLAINSRFHVSIEDQLAAADGSVLEISVKSPQFLDGIWNFAFDLETGILSSGSGAENKFVGAALRFSLGYLLKRGAAALLERRSDLEIVIQADNDFYSQLDYLQSMGQNATIDSLKAIPVFNSIQSTIAKVKKTGLGSSAAMTTSLVAAILTHFKAVTIPFSPDIVHNADLDLIHNIAQASHCFAQGKIGSGFDVSSAIYGSHTYQRFSPDILKSALECSSLGAMTDETFSALSQRWDHKVAASALPPGFIIQLGDVSTGSNTPSMVSKLLSWRMKNEQECERQWAELDSKNTELVDLFNSLRQCHQRLPQAYDYALGKLSQYTMHDWINGKNVDKNGMDADFLSITTKIYTCFQNIRSLMKIMGNAAGIAIEPDEQSRLLDACLSIPGVLMAGVPGAGGYDAIFCIVAGYTGRERLLLLWQKFNGVTPLLSAASCEGVRMDC